MGAEYRLDVYNNDIWTSRQGMQNPTWRYVRAVRGSARRRPDVRHLPPGRHCVDYANQRYYSSTIARFLTPDP
jgi:hypothetical protein